ncbi:hypothetical protein [Pseudomonas sp. P8_250]|uniref:hypothetical protein n=1 Tax=Pseudomonas sp. P8_250 TaxID=3043446 RepID=UPI002A35FC99|nr:hypothetical protein [Pseudomonas sp. P8_250]MDX9668677.1 hypothetical protein [Pseudomonas sp. P8_250]
MQISKSSWHYRLNEKAQGYSFVDRVRSRRFTTCTYIRTTIRSTLLAAFFIAALATIFLVASGLVVNALFTPIAILLGMPFIKLLVVPALITWSAVCLAAVAYLFSHFSKIIRAKMSERYDKKLTLLEQRIKDGKEGICTIVEVA